MSEHVKMFIGGAWVDAEDGATFDATSPSTGAVIGSVPDNGHESTSELSLPSNTSSVALSKSPTKMRFVAGSTSTPSELPPTVSVPVATFVAVSITTTSFD